MSRYCLDRSRSPRSSGLVSLSMEMKCLPAKPDRAEMDMERLVLLMFALCWLMNDDDNDDEQLELPLLFAMMAAVANRAVEAVVPPKRRIGDNIILVWLWMLWFMDIFVLDLLLC